MFKSCLTSNGIIAKRSVRMNGGILCKQGYCIVKSRYDLGGRADLDDFVETISRLIRVVFP
jgi:hypothetical protein